jgi:hypothetical protein
VRFRPEVLPPAIDEFFARLTALKTTARILTNVAGDPIVRSTGGWRMTDPKQQAPSANFMQGELETFVGWLLLPATRADAKEHVKANCHWKHKRLPQADVERLAQFFIGKGIPPGEITPAHLVDPVLHGEFIEWRKLRTGTARADYLHDALSLIAPRTGFLLQLVECAWDHKAVRVTPVDIDSEGWEERYRIVAGQWKAKCEKWSELLRGLLPFVTRQSKRARERLKPILDQRDLLGVISGIIKAHAADRPVAKLELGWSGAITLAIWIRDQLLLRMLGSNPLRNRNYREMRYAADNSGNLYKAVDGWWRLRYQPHEFKNEVGAVK